MVGAAFLGEEIAGPSPPPSDAPDRAAARSGSNPAGRRCATRRRSPCHQINHPIVELQIDRDLGVGGPVAAEPKVRNSYLVKWRWQARTGGDRVSAALPDWMARRSERKRFLSDGKPVFLVGRIDPQPLFHRAPTICIEAFPVSSFG